MSKEKAEKLYAELLPLARRIIAAGVEHPPMLIAEILGAVGVVPIPPGVSKNVVAELHRSLAEKEIVDAIALVTESWSFTGKLSKEIEEKLQSGAMSLEQVEGRAECVMFNIRASGEQFMAICKIDRGTGTLEKAELLDLKAGGTKWEGRFVGHGNRKLH